MKVSIDRFEGQYAICELEDGSTMEIEKDHLPQDAREGDILTINDDEITIDVEETESRKAKIAKLVNDLFD